MTLRDDYGRLHKKVAAGIVTKAITALAAGIAAKQIAKNSGNSYVKMFSGLIGAAAGAALAWIATEYKTRKTYRNVILLLAKSADDFAEMGKVEKALSIYDQILKDVPHLLSIGAESRP